MPGLTRSFSCLVYVIITATLGLGCGDVTKESPDPVGALGVSIANIIAVPGVESITLTAVGPEPFTHVLEANERKEWTYLRKNLELGSYTLTAIATDLNGVTLYETGTVNAIVTAGVTVQAVLVLHPSEPVDGVINHAPRFVSIVTDRATVRPGNPLQISFTVVDLEGDTMDLEAVDSCAIPPCAPGSFAPTALAFTNTTPALDQSDSLIWTAPSQSGLYTLRFVLTDGRSAASDFSIQVPVGDVTGNIEVDFRINMAPVVSTIVVEPLESGEVVLDASVSDDYSVATDMTYEWITDTTTCAGTFSAAEPATTFTLTSFDTGSDLCKIILTVTDEDQGVSVSQIFLNEDLVQVVSPPALRSVFQSQTDAVEGDVIEFGVEAEVFGVDVGDPINFTWTSSGASAAVPTDLGTASKLTWTAVAGELTCVADTATFSVIATVNTRPSAPVTFDVDVDPALCRP